MKIDLNNFLDVFSQVFDELDTSDFNLKTNFKENDEWDSLTALNLITILDENYEKKITGDELSNINTIQELKKFIESE